MTAKNPLLDDLAGLMTGAMGVARSAGEEVRTATQGRLQSIIADMDLAGREEVEALKAIAVKALDQVEALEARVAALEDGKA
jgi:BMFP domain-containing protein YqiC